MKKLFKWTGVGLGVVLVLGGAGYAWASFETSSLLARDIASHHVDFPIPFPLSDAEIAADALIGADLEAVALERAIARGAHLVDARYACNECHGADFGGGTMVDDPMVGHVLGPNITAGEGGRTRGYTAADWDRIVRHGISRAGRPSAMPAEDFVQMSDEELSDIVAYIQSLPNVDREVDAVSFGPLGTVLVATGKLPLACDRIRDHASAHARNAPRAEPTAAFGEHLAAVCTGCHRGTLEGGPIAAGAPDWPPAGNITPHADGLAGWTYDDFLRAMREAKRPDGSTLAFPMSAVARFADNMTETELQALWAYLQSVDARPTGE